MHDLVAHGGSDVERAVAEPVVPTSLTDEIVLRLEKAILEGVYPPGTRLRQDELCERFGVSRTPVREALRDLQARNLLVVVPNRGATVRLPSRKDALELYDVRAELEGYAAALAAGHVGSVVAQLTSAQECVSQLVNQLKQLDDERRSAAEVQLHRANAEFHAAIYLASGNDRLVSTIRQLEASFPTEYIAMATGDPDYESQALNLGEHLAIVDAISNGDGQAAREHMQAHVRHLGRVVLRFLEAQGFWT